MSQHKKLLIGLVLGIVLGVFLHPYADLLWLQAINANLLQPVGQIFLRLIFMVVVPLVFSALVIASNELGMSHGLAKIARKTLLYTVLISTLSVIIAISLTNIIKPGAGFVISEAQRSSMAQNTAGLAQISDNVHKSKSIAQALIELVPKNPLDSAVRALDGEMIPLMIFALIFGWALSRVTSKSEKSNNSSLGSKLSETANSESVSKLSETAPNLLIAVFEQIFAVSMRILNIAMSIAPYGVFVLAFNTVFVAGYKILFSLFYYILTVLLALLIQQFVVYSTVLKLIAKRNPWEFFKACQDVYLYAFSTSSSNATLPKSLATAEGILGIPKVVARFVLTVGATANQNGTAIFEGVTALFLAQVYGVDLSMSQQIYVVIFSILAGVGTAGVPGGSLPLIMILLTSVGIPAEGMGIILGVDRFLDMCRTTINVSGDLVIAAMISPRSELAPVPIIRSMSKA